MVKACSFAAAAGHWVLRITGRSISPALHQSSAATIWRIVA